MTSTITTTGRYTDLDALKAVLDEQQSRKLDLIVPAGKLGFDVGRLKLSGLNQVVEDDGVTDPNGIFDLGEVFNDKLADQLKVPVNILRQLHGGREDLYDHLVQGLFRGRKSKQRAIGVIEGEPMYEEVWGMIPPQDKSYLVRLLSDGHGGGIARSIHSSKYQAYDNLDFLVALMSGIRDAGIPVTIQRADLSERRMTVVLDAPQIQTMAAQLLDGMRDPFEDPTAAALRATKGQGGMSFKERVEMGKALMASGEFGRGHHIYERGSEPIVCAGLAASNSETGDGALSLSFVVRIVRCTNGWTMAAEGLRKTHLGARLDDGVVAWSGETQRHNLNLVKSQVKDMVGKLLSQEHLEKTVATITEAAGHPIEKAEDAVTAVAKKLSFSEEEREAVLAMFMRGGQMTSGGIGQAMTAAAQTLTNPDRAFALESKAFEATVFASKL